MKLQEDWLAQFGKYKASPEYQKVNRCADYSVLMQNLFFLLLCAPLLSTLMAFWSGTMVAYSTVLIQFLMCAEA